MRNPSEKVLHSEQFKAERRRSRVNLAMVILVIIAMCIGIYRIIKAAPVETVEGDPKGAFWVEVTGQVVSPDYYVMHLGDTMNEVIIMAGGLTEGADTDAVDRTAPLDTAGKYTIDIPARPDYIPPVKLKPAETEYPININTATIEELMSLPHIGEGIARRIVQYREENGPFKQISDIREISGVGEKTYDDIYGLIITGYENETGEVSSQENGLQEDTH